MRHQGAIRRWAGVGEAVSRSSASRSAWSTLRGAACAAVLLLTALVAAPAAAQSTAVTITGARPATFARVGQVLTFNVRLDTGNSPIDALRFTSGSPAGMSALSCPGLPADLQVSTTCTFTYTTQPMDMAMGTITALGRWTATRPGGVTRSGNTNTLVVSYAPPRAPDAPVIGTATAGNAQATVTFAAPDFDGGQPVDSYTVTSVPGGLTATGAASPLTVTGLTNGVAYRFNVAATNMIGTGAGSASSNSVTPAAPQTIDFANPGAQDFGTAPALVATASSGLAVAFSSSSPGVCTVTADGALTFVSAGTCSITARQAGNAAFSAAPPVSQSFAVNAVVPGAPGIGLATAGDRTATVAFTAPASTGGVAITGYTVTASPGGLTTTGAASPLTVAGLANGTAYTFTVTAGNSAGTGPSSAPSNSVVPSSVPVVTHVIVPASGLYGPGQDLDFVVEWDQPVDVTGTPALALVIGATTVQARYLSGTGTARTTFRYTVLPAQRDADGITVSALGLDDGRIRNAYGRDAALALASVDSTAGVLVGELNRAPVNSVPAAQSVQEGGALAFTAGNALSVADADAAGGALRVTLGVGRGLLSLSGTAGLTFIAGGPSGSAGMTFEGDLASINAALDGLVYRPAPGYFGPDTLRIASDDLGHTGFGGAGTDEDTVAITVVPLDHTPPAVTAIDRLDGSPTRAASVRFAVAFSEAVSGLDAADFRLVATGSARGTIAAVAAVDAAHYTVTVDGLGGDGSLRLDLDGGTDVADAAGNRAAGFSTGHAYDLDTTAPVVTAVAVPADGQYVAGQRLVFTVAFSEAVIVTGTPGLPVILDAGTREAAYTGGTGTSALRFEYTVAPGDRDLDGIAVGTDLALNGGVLADAVGNPADATLRGVAGTGGITVGPLPQAITGFAATPSAPVYAPDGTFTVAATGGASGNPVVFASTTATVCSVSGATVTMLTAGTCGLTADQAGNANYDAAPQASLAVAIGAGAQVLDFGVQPAQTFVPGGRFVLAPVATASSGLPVAYSSQSPAVCTIAGTSVTMLSAGTCTIAADQAGDANYTAAPQVTQAIAIGQAAQAITGFVVDPATPVYAPNGTFTVAATGGASGNPVLFASTTPSVCSVSGAIVTMRAAGTCVLTADQAGDANYEPAAQLTQSIAIGQAVQAITGFAATPSAPVYAPNGTFALAATGGASGNPVVFASTTATVCSVNGTTVTMLSAGTCTLTADQAGNADYQAAPQANLAVTIGAGQQTLDFGAQAARTFVPGGSFALDPPATASSGLPVAYSTPTPAVCTISGTTVTMHAAGTCTIAADQAGDANYTAAAQVTQAIAIGQAAQAITAFAATPSAPVYAPNGTFALAATGGASGNPVVFASTTTAVCSVSGTTVTMLSAGTCALTADQAGNANYGPAPRAILEVAIGKAVPTLAWAADISRTYGEAAFDLPDPSSTAPGAFTFASSNAQVATVSGRTVTITGAGTTVLTATQAASANYAAASVTLRLSVDDRPDPTRDATVAAGLQAQADASLRFARAQQDNIRGRLGQLREGGNASSNGMTVDVRGGAGQPGLSLAATPLQAAMPALPQGWGVWTAGSIVLGERDANGARRGIEFRSDGVSAGVDRTLGGHAVLGAAAGLGWDGSDLDDGRSTLDARQRALALYGLWRDDALFVDGIVGRGRLDFDIHRWSEAAGAMATAQRDGEQTFASLTLGYASRGARGTLTGFGRVDGSRTTLDAYRETGLGIHDLQYRTQDIDNSTAAAGLEGRYLLRTASALIRPYWTLEWRQSLQSPNHAAMNYAVLPRGGDYLLGLRSYGDDTLGAGAGVDVGFDNGWSLALQLRRDQSRELVATMFGLRVSYGMQRPATDAFMQTDDPAQRSTPPARP